MESKYKEELDKFVESFRWNNSTEINYTNPYKTSCGYDHILSLTGSYDLNQLKPISNLSEFELIYYNRTESYVYISERF